MESKSFYLVAHLLTVKFVLSWRFLIASMYIILHVLFVVGACAWSLCIFLAENRCSIDVGAISGSQTACFCWTASHWVIIVWLECLTRYLGQGSTWTFGYKQFKRKTSGKCAIQLAMVFFVKCFSSWFVIGNHSPGKELCNYTIPSRRLPYSEGNFSDLFKGYVKTSGGSIFHRHHRICILPMSTIINSYVF